LAWTSYALTYPGISPQVQDDSVRLLLQDIALLGQWNVIYAKPNAGKTLVVLHLIIESIKASRVKASNVFFFDLDDNHSGLVEKIKIAELYGFHVICDGYEGFQISQFIPSIEELIAMDQARGIIIIIDTLRKVTDLMQKRLLTRFGRLMRRLILKGATLIVLAHVNKKPGEDGKPVYAGTTDIIDDADCAYVGDIVAVDTDNQYKVVEFECKKRRGDVAERVSYRYSTADGLSYMELLETVEKVDSSEVSDLKQSETKKADTELVDIISNCIQQGIKTKIALRDALSDQAGISRRAAGEVIDRYTGTDHQKHRWNFTVQEHGKKVFQLLEVNNHE
jgi:hypothetical protein